MDELLVLTKYLYCADEVTLSLLDCLLEKRSLGEALFWISEYYNSGFIKESWILLWQIYFDFYAITNPKFFKKLYNVWKKPQTIDNVLYIVKNLFMSNSCWHVFLFRLKKYKQPLLLYLSKKKLSHKERLIKSIKKRHIANLRYYIDKIDITDYKFLIEYFKKEEQSTFKFYEYPKEVGFSFISYYILSHMDLKQSKKQNSICHKILKEERNVGKDIDNTYGYQRYTVLPKKRLYQISNKIGCFEKKRDNIIILENRLLTLKEIYWYYWLYFAQFSPIWKERIENFEGCVDSKTYTVNFPTVEKEEEFYEKYGLEPDEQTKECQLQSVLEIPDNTIAEWLNDKFNLELTTKDVKCETYSY